MSLLFAMFLFSLVMLISPGLVPLLFFVDEGKLSCFDAGNLAFPEFMGLNQVLINRIA